MYAVIRAGGKQYRVAPGDVIEVEKLPQESGAEVQFAEVLAFSGKEGELAKPANAVVTGQVVEQKRGDKVLVFHYKRKKQYKKLQGHRQAYTAVKITGHQHRRPGAQSVMLTCQLMMAAMAAIKRFDSHLLHWWASAGRAWRGRELLANWMAKRNFSRNGYAALSTRSRGSENQPLRAVQIPGRRYGT